MLFLLTMIRKTITYRKKKSKNVELMKDKLSGRIITEFAALRPKI